MYATLPKLKFIKELPLTSTLKNRDTFSKSGISKKTCPKMGVSVFNLRVVLGLIVRQCTMFL